MMPKLVFTWRTSRPKHLEESIERLDNSITASLRLLVAGDGPGFGSFQLLLSSLPVNMGGLGISLAADLAKFTYAASVFSTLHLQNSILGALPAVIPENFKDSMDSFSSSIFPGLTDSASELSTKLMLPHSKLQNKMAHIFFEAKRASILNHDYILDKSLSVQRSFRAILSSTVEPVASSWLFAIPNAGLMQKMTGPEFRAVLAYRLLMPQYSSKQFCQCTNCVKPMDTYGYHVLNCSGKRFDRHETVRDALLYLANKAGFHAEKKANVTCLGPDPFRLHLLKPADILMDGDDFPKDCVDITVVCPLAANINADIMIGKKVEESERKKYSKHKSACEDSSYGFKAFAVDVFGVIAKRSRELLDRVTNSMVSNSGYPPWLAKAISHRRISIAIQIGVARQVVGQKPLVSHH
jgi:hypothetical protein